MRIYIPDRNFRAALIRLGVVFNGHGYTDSELVERITSLNLNGLGIKDLSGIEHFKELSVLDLIDNKISEIDLSQNHKIDELDIKDNCLRKLDLSHRDYMYTIDCAHNLIDKLILPKNGAYHMFAQDNKIAKREDLINFDVEDACFTEFYDNPGDWWHSLVKDLDKGNRGLPGEFDSE